MEHAIRSTSKNLNSVQQKRKCAATHSQTKPHGQFGMSKTTTSMRMIKPQKIPSRK